MKSSRFCTSEMFHSSGWSRSPPALGSLKLFPKIPPRRIQPQTPPRLPAFLLAAFSPEKDRRWSGKKKKKEINPCRFSSSSCRLLESLFGRTRISAPAVPGSRIRQVTAGSGFAFYLFNSPAQHVGWEVPAPGAAKGQPGVEVAPGIHPKNHGHFPRLRPSERGAAGVE